MADEIYQFTELLEHVESECTIFEEIATEGSPLSIWVKFHTNADPSHSYPMVHTNLTDAIRRSVNNAMGSEGFPLFTEKDKVFWLLQADMLEIEARRIRSIVSAAKEWDALSGAEEQ